MAQLGSEIKDREIMEGVSGRLAKLTMPLGGPRREGRRNVVWLSPSRTAPAPSPK